MQTSSIVKVAKLVCLSDLPMEPTWKTQSCSLEEFLWFNSYSWFIDNWALQYALIELWVLAAQRLVGIKRLSAVRHCCSLSSSKLASWSADCWACLIQKSSCCWISSVLIGPLLLFSGFPLQLWTNRQTQAPIRRPLGNEWLISTWCRASCLGTATERTSRFTLASVMVSGVGSSIMSGGQFAVSLSQVGPWFQRLLLTTFPPRLPRSAGLSSVGTWCQLTYPCCWILFTWFDTNCRYSPWPLIQ